ncbi:MAG: TonB-dependent receptor, partial [Flavobacteriales bacterium]|nr:TonB-dependent receptor [Flavobacteriales bacterium]
MKQFLFLFFLTASVLFAQEDYTLSGFIREAVSSEELIGANVVCEDLNIGATTNAYGFYSISLPQGNYNIRYSFIGYGDKVIQVTLDKSQRVDVNLSAYAEQLSEIVLEDEALQKVRSIEMSVNKLETKAVKELAAVFGEVDIIKSIQLLPGVTSVGEGANGFNVRGGAADENLVLLDEMTLYNASHLFGFFSVFNADAIKDMKLYKGGIPAEYGSRVSSVLDVRQKEGNSNFTEASGGIGLISSRFMVEGPLWDRSSFMVAGRRSYGDLFLKLSSDSVLRDNKLYFYDLNMKLNSWLGEKDRLFLSSYMGRDAFKFGSLFASSWGNETLNLRWLHLFSDRMVSNLSYNFNDYDYLISILPEGFEFDWESKIRNHQFKYDVSYYHSNEHQFKGGVSVNKYHFEPGLIAPASDSSAITTFNMRDKFAYEAALFLQDEWKISERLLVKAG